MTVYVDDAAIGAEVFNIATGRKVKGTWYHMFSDRLDSRDLHEMAATIGLRRSYFQRSRYIAGPLKGFTNHSHDHYDVTESKKRAAIKNGAVPVTMTQAVMIWRDKRERELAARERKGQVNPSHSFEEQMKELNDMVNGEGRHALHTQRQIGRCVHCSCGARAQGRLLKKV